MKRPIGWRDRSLRDVCQRERAPKGARVGELTGPDGLGLVPEKGAVNAQIQQLAARIRVHRPQVLPSQFRRLATATGWCKIAIAVG